MKPKKINSLSAHAGYLAAAKQSLWIFSRLICERDKLAEEHIAWQDYLDYQYLLFLAPRESLKTTIWAECLITQTLLDNPEARILLVCDTAEHAGERVRAINAHLRRPLAASYSPGLEVRLAAAMPLKQGVISLPIIDSKGQIQPRQAKEASLTACGITTPQTGGHYDLIICDDVVNEKDRHSKVIRRQKASWLPTVFDLLDSNGQLIFIGTRWHGDDLYATIMKDYAGQFMVKKQSIYNSDGSLWYPAAYQDRLDILKRNPVNFAHQYLNESISGSDTLFDESWFIAEEHKIVYTIMGVDPAYSESDVENACDCAAVIWGMDDKGKLGLVDARMVRESLYQFKQTDFMALYQLYKPNWIVVENNGVQKAALDLMKICEFPPDDPNRAEFLTAKAHMIGTGDITTGNKVTRAQPMADYAEANGIWYRDCPHVRELLYQLLSFPACDKDDGVDAAVNGFARASTHRYSILPATTLHIPEETRLPVIPKKHKSFYTR